MTVYNREAYIAECLESILGSTYARWELIVVDDCSTDGSVEIAREYAKADDRVQLHVNERNLGDYANRNRAASYARGKYLKYLDADDVIYPHSLRIMVEAMERYPEAGFGLSQNVIDGPRPYPQAAGPAEVYRAFFFGPNVLGVGPSAAIIRREAFGEVGGFSGEQYIGDTELWLKLARRAPVVKLQPALVWWRQHAGQQIESERRDPRVVVSRYRLKMRALRWADSMLDEEEKARARRWVRHRHGRTIWNLALRQGRFWDALSVMRSSGTSPSDLLLALMPRTK